MLSRNAFHPVSEIGPSWREAQTIPDDLYLFHDTISDIFPYSEKEAFSFP